ncbi:MAG: trehalose-6-phosphate synthase [Bdellovibrionales bacterium]|nr:trehalose-6-phosphate synthase [Bdellovibrionales bacterium]
MRLALSFVLPLLAVLALIAYATIPLFDSLTLRWSVRDLEVRSRLVANTLGEPLTRLLDENSNQKIVKYFEAVTRDERLFAIAYCGENGREVKTPNFPSQISCATHIDENSSILRVKNGSLHIALDTVTDLPGHLVLVHDMSFVERRSSDTRKYLFYLFGALGLVISLVTVVVAQLNWHRLLSKMKGLVRGGAIVKRLSQIDSPELLPLAKDLRVLIRDIETERLARDENQISWTPAALKKILNEELAGDEIMIVSNREPYIHNFKNGKIEAQFPASGLVTALEPVMRACSGTWIAHGSGSADKEVVDKYDRVRVPPDKPSYQIRRVWFSKEEELGYYYGFSNEGLWPLCHMAYTRPVFRTSDWEQYKTVNQKFADVVVEEARTDDPVILVQDYHLALLPGLIRKRLPKATIITFWHIPWPNPETFGICPWREEILAGMLGSSILGFHTRYHCNNFIDTIDRYLEARIDRETSTVSHRGKLTAIKSYPISIEWPGKFINAEKSAVESARDIRLRNDLSKDILLGVGVDRLDYTKGILERFLAVERLLELHNEWIGKFSFVQIAAPSRSSIEQYQNFEGEVRAMAARINSRFGRSGYQPIVLKIEHHSPDQVFEYFRASDVCMVTSLHDGMNLVAKEFVASRDDERGSLILSQFTGASRELQAALIVNPYDIDQCAKALHMALSMPEEEQRERMRSMRGLLQEFNVYRWAGRMLIDASRIRQQNRLSGRIQDTEFTI